MNLLLVEDSESVAEALKAALELAGHTVSVCGTMRAAVDALERLPIEGAIIDGHFPSYDISHPPAIWGPDLLAFCRGLGIRCVLHSGDDSLVWAETQAGRKALSKPASVDEILDALEDGHE